LSSLSLEKKAKQAVAAAIESHDGARKRRPNRLGLLWAGSALLHVVAVIALLHSWDSAPSKAMKRPAPVVQIAVDEIQVVRLELAVESVRNGEIVNAVHTEPDETHVPHVAVPDGEKAKTKVETKKRKPDSLQLRPAANASTTPRKDSDARNGSC
jgi:hypothetical protein